MSSDPCLAAVMRAMVAKMMRRIRQRFFVARVQLVLATTRPQSVVIKPRSILPRQTGFSAN